MKGYIFYLNLSIALSAIALVLHACQPAPGPEPIKFRGEAQGTYYAVTYYDEQGRNLQPSIDSILKSFDQTASLWVEQSLLSRINRNDSTATLNEDFIAIFETAMEVGRLSGGAFDITVGPLVRAWGFGPDGPQAIDTTRIDSLLAYVGADKVMLRGDTLVKSSPGVMIDLNAIAQGYAVDMLGQYLEAKGIGNYIIDIGGEVLAKGTKPGGELWKIGIEKPADSAGSERVIESVLQITGKAMATSGNYRKYYERGGVRYSHTIDPRTGYPVEHSMLSASVIADNCCLADAWATAFMVMGKEETMKFAAKNKFLDVYLIYSDQSGEVETWHSEGFGKYLKK
jgi:thiamine biosynthesis lipoprotein